MGNVLIWFLNIFFKKGCLVFFFVEFLLGELMILSELDRGLFFFCLLFLLLFLFFLSVDDDLMYSGNGLFGICFEDGNYEIVFNGFDLEDKFDLLFLNNLEGEDIDVFVWYVLIL